MACKKQNSTSSVKLEVAISEYFEGHSAYPKFYGCAKDLYDSYMLMEILEGPMSKPSAKRMFHELNDRRYRRYREYALLF